MPHRICCGLVVAVLGIGFNASTALADPPTPGNDTLNAAPTGALDVLANDSDTEGDALTVTGNTQPAHGTATCSATGACFYSAAGGYTGSDSFTYTVADPAHSTATGTVNVNVTASTVSQAIAATDDDVATLAGHQVSFNILANDRGQAPLTVQSWKPANHGTATCGADGNCTYQPANGFSGRDGFTYVLHDGTGNTRNAAAHIAVAPAGSAFGITTAGLALNPAAGGAVPPGGQAGWFSAATPSPGDLPSDELPALGLPTLSTMFGGAHTLTAGSVSTAAGWTVDSIAGDGSIKAHATSAALLGSAVSQLFPRPTPPISQGTGGDGHVPILVGTKVFAFFHHQIPTQASCVDRATGQVCPGYPKQLNVGASDIIGPGAVNGSQIWIHALPSSSYANDWAAIGLYCWDAATDSSCGMAIVDRAQHVSTSAGDLFNNPGGTAPVLVNGKLWFAAVTGKLYCVDPNTGGSCATPSLNTGLTGNPQSQYAMDIVAHGSRVFVSQGSGFSQSGGSVACLDVAALAPCSGWSTPKSLGGSWFIINEHDASGAATGVCAIAGSQGTCAPDANPGSTTSFSNFPSGLDGYYDATEQAETGTRTLLGSLEHAGLACWNWSTLAPCTGGGYDSGGWLNTDASNNGLPSAYGATFDGACAIALGDPGQVFTVDPAGVSPCTSLRSGSSLKAVDLRSQRCDGAVGNARWGTVALTDTNSEELSSMPVNVRDAGTGAVLLSGDLIQHGTLDLSAINATAHPSLIIDASAVSKSGNTPWDDGVPPRIVLSWTPDARAVCAHTTGASQCSNVSPSPLQMLTHLTDPADATATLNLNRPACAATGVQASHSILAAPQRCVSLWRFSIHIQNVRPLHIVSATITVAGRRPIRVSGRHLTAPVDLRHLPFGTFTVKIVARQSDGHLVRGSRTYHTCRSRHLRGHSRLLL